VIEDGKLVRVVILVGGSYFCTRILYRDFPLCIAGIKVNDIHLELLLVQ
jgi:hypothetical protein